MKHNIVKGLLLLLLFAQCSKDNTSNDLDIKTMAQYWDSDFDTKRAFKLRLAFAKTVARAFADREFARYFKENYGVSKDNHFEELFFGIEADKVIGSSGRTIYALFESCIDPEARDLFGDDFLDLVLRYDPCVVIKLPDLFRDFEWDERQVVPMVVPQLFMVPKPGELLGENNRFVCYHFTGKQKLVHDRFDFFHVTVKYSEDFALIDPQTLLNERAISLYEFIPQAADDDQIVRAIVAEEAVPHVFHTGMSAINKMRVFNKHLSLKRFQGAFWQDKDCPSSPNCIRECIPIDESILAFDSLVILTGLIFNIKDNPYLLDSYTHSLSIWSLRSEDPFFARFCIPSLPYCWFDAWSVEVKQLSHNAFSLPAIDFEAKLQKPNRAFPVRMVLLRQILPDARFYIMSHNIVYAMEENRFQVAPDTYGQPSRVTASHIFSWGSDVYTGCIQNVRLLTGGEIFKLRY